MRRCATRALTNMARMSAPVLMPSLDSSFMRSLMQLGLIGFRGCIGWWTSALAKGGWRDAGVGIWSKVRCSAKLPVRCFQSRRDAVAVGETGGGIDIELGQSVVDAIGRALQLGVVADGRLVEDEVEAGLGMESTAGCAVPVKSGPSMVGEVWDHWVRNFS